MNYYDRAKELAEQTVAHRRYMHTNAEAGLDLPKTKAYVMEPDVASVASATTKIEKVMHEKN